MLHLLKSIRSRPSLLTGLPIQRRIVVWLFVLAFVVGAAAYLGYRNLHEEISQDANTEAEREMQRLQDLLELHRQLYLAHVRASLELLKRDTLQLGPPHISGTVVMDENDLPLPNLVFGTTPMAFNTELVDGVRKLMGGTTAIFVRSGDSFVRIATNVLDKRGVRALETPIDPKGQAVVALRKGEVYAGILDVLGSPYIGEDAPIFNDKGEVIGAWFVGFKIENLTELISRITSQHILENGFVALYDQNNRLVAQSDHMVSPEVDQLCYEAALADVSPTVIQRGKWCVRKETFEPWNYDIVSATYLPDVVSRTLGSIWLVFTVVGVIGVGALITQGIALLRSQMLKDEAEKARMAAEEASRTKSAFLANMSHELRTPLNAIIGYSEMLVEDATDQGLDDMTPDLKKIQSSGKHLLALINDILDLSKIEAGKMTLYLEEFSVPQMVTEIASTIHPLLLKNGNELEIDCPSEIGNIYTDLTKTRQILFNLLSNASKFTNKGKIILRCRRDPKMIHFAVQDTGVGMTPEEQSKLFREFSQADDSTTRKYGGTGLGLAISKRFSEMLGGAIKLESQRGVGTTFFVDLPVKAVAPAGDTDVEVKTKPKEAPVDPDEIVPELSVAAPLVVVIDDDPVVQDLLRRIFEKEGYRVQLVSDGRDALATAEKTAPNLITLDIMMPGMDGWTVLAALKDNVKTRDIPVVVITIVDNKPMALALGAVDCISKPFDRERIIDLLQRHGPALAPRVLIVEDDINSYEVLARTLEKDGYKVAYAPDGRVGLDMVTGLHPKVIVLDLMMPEMNGFDFVTELRKHETGAKTPVIVLSARELTHQEREWLHQHVQKVILKGSMSMHDLALEVGRFLPNAPEAAARAS